MYFYFFKLRSHPEFALAAHLGNTVPICILIEIQPFLLIFI